MLKTRTKARDIVLGGGVFFNKIILAQIKQGLEKAGMKVHVPGPELLSDNGLSLGQAMLALS
jgi:hydrogenase maturation factor HypF (carbamoyltransferase family)